MPKGIGQRSIGGRVGVAQRQIAARYGPGLGQIVADFTTNTNTPVTITPGTAGILYVYGVGSGAGGSSGGTIGGGGAAAGFSAIRVSSRSTITHQGVPVGGAAATDGGDLVITVDGRTMTAGGGKASGVGGVATGFDINRNGGASGAAGLHGGSAGATVGSQVGGGGCAGFLPISANGSAVTSLAVIFGNGGDGNSGGAGVAGGRGSGGGAGSTTGGGGGNAGLYFVIIQDVAK